MCGCSCIRPSELPFVRLFVHQLGLFVVVFRCIRLSRLSLSGVVGFSKPLLYSSSASLFAAVEVLVDEPAGLVYVFYSHSPTSVAGPQDAGLVIVNLDSGDLVLKCCLTPNCAGGDTPSQCAIPTAMFPKRCVAGGVVVLVLVLVVVRVVVRVVVLGLVLAVVRVVCLSLCVLLCVSLCLS